MKIGAVLVLLALVTGCRSGGRATAESPGTEPTVASSCSITCDTAGGPARKSITCAPGFEAVCDCTQLPVASCQPVGR